ncbi:transposase [Lysobacter sp. CCNWLW3]|uniref:REP-associated tyrosine transposase n=1 Tax=unclassified Lysobacter TaxID=2635362 RepID=UPI002FD7037D
MYLVTFTTERRRPSFCDESLCATMVDALLDRRLWTRSRLLAWVLMPDHWHGLVELGPWETLPDLVRQLKTNTSRRLRAVDPSLSVVWASGYHDRALRCQESLIDAARYVVLNPVRAGLVRRVRDYRYWGAVWA